MDGSDRAARRPSLAERLGLKGFSSCCGASWGVGPSNVSVREDGDDEDDDVEENGLGPISAPTEPVNSSPPCGMNLAAALAAERQLWAALDFPGHNRSPASPTNEAVAGTTVEGTPSRVSLMRLLEETDGYDCLRGAEGSDQLCCVCMGRKKGAAFIPCGHTFCRVCSSELWLNRATCPLCNRLIREVLHIY